MLIMAFIFFGALLLIAWGWVKLSSIQDEEKKSDGNQARDDAGFYPASNEGESLTK